MLEEEEDDYLICQTDSENTTNLNSEYAYIGRQNFGILIYDKCDSWLSMHNLYLVYRR